MGGKGSNGVSLSSFGEQTSLRQLAVGVVAVARLGLRSFGERTSLRLDGGVHCHAEAVVSAPLGSGLR